jgi:hypothetical protein
MPSTCAISRPVLSLVVVLLAPACGRPVLQPDSGSSPDATGTYDRGVQPDAQPPPAGCSSSAQCTQHEFCKIDGACAVSGGKLGTCTGYPTPCSLIDAPVCGCDGKTYGNGCFANSAGVNIAYSGACTAKCGNLMNLPACPADEICDHKSCGGAEGSCVKKPTSCPPPGANSPVFCGCDGKTYTSECERLLAGIALNHEGVCTPGISLVSDKSLYAWGQSVKGTLTNGTTSSVFLGGCGAFAIERKEASVWVDKGSTVDCVWEGNAIEVMGGASHTENVYPFVGGTYRLRADYGLGCTPGQPLSSAKCTSFAKVYSYPFVFQPDLKECLSLISSYSAALSKAKVCDPTTNMPQCLVKVSASLACGCETYVQSDTPLTPIVQSWIDLSCAAASSLPGCPPMPCSNPKGSGCMSGQCTDLTF